MLTWGGNIDELKRAYERIAATLMADEKRHLKAIAAGEPYPFNATTLESLGELRLITVRDGKWGMTAAGHYVSELL